MFWKKKNKKNIKNTDITVEYTLRTDTGLMRKNNEDAVKCINFNSDDKGFLAIVADGMGGHKSGEVASKMATEIIPEVYYQSDSAIPAALQEAFKAANNAILEKSRSSSQYNGMGTTCTALAIVGDKAFFAHVGDSRLYLFRDNELIQLTKDHTIVQKMIDEGTLSKAQARDYPQKNVIWQAMGTKNTIDIQVNRKALPVKENDRFLLCSDGLTDMVDDMEIAQILKMPSLNMAASCLVAMAKDKGGHDNISVIVIQTVKYDRQKENNITRKIKQV